MRWHRIETRLSFGETDESIWVGGGRQFSRILATAVCASAVVMLDTPCSEVVWRVLVTHYIHQFPLHFPARASLCAITFQLDSTTNLNLPLVVSWNVMAHAPKPEFRLSAKRTSPFKSAEGRQFSRLLAAEVCASAVVMLDTPCSEVVWRVLATHSIRHFPLHFQSRAWQCAITFQLESTNGISWRGKGGRCLGLKTLSLSLSDCLETLEAPKSLSRPVNR